MADTPQSGEGTNMSSAGINFSGLASGIDTKAVIEALMAVERRPLLALESKKKSFEKQKSLFGDFETKLSKLRTAAKAMKTATSFLDYKAAVDSDTFFTATASSGATTGSYDIKVTQLAQAKVGHSNGRADKATAADYQGDFKLTVNGNDYTVSLASASTLEQVASAINSSSAGAVVQATVLDTGSGAAPYQLVLTSKTTGANGAFTIDSTGANTNLTALLAEVAANTSTAAQNAIIEVNGIGVTRSTNTITDAIAGVTLNLKSKHTTGTTKLTLTTDATAVAKKVKDFVDAYNEVVEFVRTQNEQDTKGNAKNPLFGDSTLSTIRSTLRGIAGATFDTGNPAYSMLALVGVSSDKDGKLNFDQTKFEAAVVKDEVAVKKLFTDTANGIALRIHDQADKYLSSVDGLLLTRKQGFDRLVKQVDDQIAQGSRRLESYEKQLKQKFSAMEALVSRLQGQGSALGAVTRR